MNKKNFILILICLLAGLAYASEYRSRIMDFENPGNRRIRRMEETNHWYYRSLPEQPMTLKTEDVKRVQIRSFSIKELRKPQIFVIIDGQRTAFDLVSAEFKDGYYFYEDFEFDIPEDTASIELLCYQRSIYMRPYEIYEYIPKVKVVRKPSRVIQAHAGMIDVTHGSTNSEYYTFNRTQPFRFTLNNGRDCVVYVRAQLTDRRLPRFNVYKDGELVETQEFSLARSSKFHATGVKYLTIGMKVELPDNEDSSEYELRADSEHMFMAKPVYIKK